MKTKYEMKKAVKEDGRMHPTKGRRPINMQKQEKWVRGNRFLAAFWGRLNVLPGA